MIRKTTQVEVDLLTAAAVVAVLPGFRGRNEVSKARGTVQGYAYPRVPFREPLPACFPVSWLQVGDQPQQDPVKLPPGCSLFCPQGCICKCCGEEPDNAEGAPGLPQPGSYFSHPGFIFNLLPLAWDGGFFWEGRGL